MRIKVHKINEREFCKKGSNGAEFATILEILQLLKSWVNSRTCIESASIFDDKNSVNWVKQVVSIIFAYIALWFGLLLIIFVSDSEHEKRWREWGVCYE